MFSTLDIPSELVTLYKKISRLNLPSSVMSTIDQALESTRGLTAEDGSYIIAKTRLYLINVLSLPWSHVGPPAPEPVGRASKLLDKSHAAMNKVKENILAMAAAERHVQNALRGRDRPEGQPPKAILLVGPPGVGKTSIAFAMAKVLRREMYVISLAGRGGGISLLRGESRVYHVSEPGEIMKSFITTKSRHPLILLDEIDKIDAGDKNKTINTLLEVFDGKLSTTFHDNYFDFHFDVSRAVFICTANSVDDLPEPLLSRMEIITLESYIDREKIDIATYHLIPSVRDELCLAPKQFKITDKAMLRIIHGYTKESGVRQLRAMIRQLAMRYIKAESGGLMMAGRHVFLGVNDVERLLGPKHYIPEPLELVLRPGVSCGLTVAAWGGDIQYVEVSPLFEGKDPVLVTGITGQSMFESVLVARSLVLSETAGHDGPTKFHVHFPDGGTPKDGPSAGIAITSALYGLRMGLAVPVDIAMTGEVTLRGRIVAVGGIYDKLVAALRYGKKRLIVAAENRPDIERISMDLRSQIQIIYVDDFNDLIHNVFSLPKAAG